MPPYGKVIDPSGSAAQLVSPLLRVSTNRSAIAWAHGFQSVVTCPALATGDELPAREQRHQTALGVDVEVVQAAAEQQRGNVRRERLIHPGKGGAGGENRLRPRHAGVGARDQQDRLTGDEALPTPRG